MTHSDAHFPIPNNPARNMMLGQLLTGDIADKRILGAMTVTPRENFVPAALKGACYVDDDLPLGGGQALIAPLTLAKLLDLAGIHHTDNVLVIGKADSYSFAIVKHLSGHVTASEGGKAAAPYDVIVIPGGVQQVPASLTGQLAMGGRVVAVRVGTIPAGQNGGPGRGIIVTKTDGGLQEREHFDAAATLLPGFETPAGFVF